MAVKESPLVTSLLKPAAYPEPTSEVGYIETHVSHIFLTDRHVYKVKKPVEFGFLDFTTLRKRHYYCRAEVALNRRLSPDVYLGVSRITREGAGYAVDGRGRTVEYAVKMRRLPAERALDELLRRDAVTVTDIERIAEKVAAFHVRAATGPSITRLGGLAPTRRNVEENFRQTEPFIGSVLPLETFDDLAAYSRAFMDAKKAAFRRREHEGKIRDCHGDLHTAQVFLENGIGIIDCIEFNRRYRYSDVAEDVAFLAMDLDHYGRPDLARVFVSAYVERSGDAGVGELLPFYKTYRAYVRGKVNCLRMAQPGVDEAAQREAEAAAKAYFELAHGYTEVFTGPLVVMVGGLSGAGKTTAAQELGRRWGMEVVSSDVVRKTLAGVALTKRPAGGYGEGLYSEEMTRRTYDAVLARAEASLKTGRPVVLDGTYRRADERRRVVEMVRKLGCEVWMVVCTLPLEETVRRLDARARSGVAVSDADRQVFLRQRGEWEPVREVSLTRLVELDTSGTVEEMARRLLYGLFLAVLR
jgi:aminoglycoside phosphotransferase family enzyme/predicted kinase